MLLEGIVTKCLVVKQMVIHIHCKKWSYFLEVLYHIFGVTSVVLLALDKVGLRAIDQSLNGVELPFHVLKHFVVVLNFVLVVQLSNECLCSLFADACSVMARLCSSGKPPPHLICY